MIIGILASNSNDSLIGITAGLYPLIITDSGLSATAGLSSSTLVVTAFTPEMDIDTLAVSASIGNGSLTTTLQTQTLEDIDTLAVSASIGNGTLRVTLTEHALEDIDQLSATASVGSGTLEVTLISHTIEDIDTLAASASIGNGTLI